MSRALDRSLIELCKAFNRYHVRYVVVGGFAVIMHGLARMTEDIDFFIEDTAENIQKIKTALNSLYDDPLVDELKFEDMKYYAVIRYGTPDNFHIRPGMTILRTLEHLKQNQHWNLNLIHETGHISTQIPAEASF